MQTNYSVDSTKYVLGQVADTSLKQIDSFQLVNKDGTTRSYARFGDVVMRAAQGANSTAQVVLRSELAADQTKAKIIGIVARDDSYGLDVYQTKLATDVDDSLIKRNLMNIIRKGRIVVQVSEAVIAGDPAFPVPITADFDTANIKYRNDNSSGASEQIGVFITSAATNGDLAIIEINFSN